MLEKDSLNKKEKAIDVFFFNTLLQTFLFLCYKIVT